VYCVTNIIGTIQMFISLGFIIHPTKSILIPTQKLVFWGIVLDSVLMQVYLTQEKSRKAISVCSDLYHSKCYTIRAVSRVIGYIISSFLGVMYGPIYFWQPEREKTLALKCHQGNFNSTMLLSEESLTELKWWIDSIESSYNVVHHGQPELTLKTDASTAGWGCFLEPVSAGGLWTDWEAKHHTNYLELLAIFLALKVFVKTIMDKYVKVFTDNCTAMADINHMGTSSCPNRNALAKEIRLWCSSHNIGLTASHISGVSMSNVEAHRQSRTSQSQLTWTLNPKIFRSLFTSLVLT